jgi:hypothetical protein
VLGMRKGGLNMSRQCPPGSVAELTDHVRVSNRQDRRR